MDPSHNKTFKNQQIYNSTSKSSYFIENERLLKKLFLKFS